MEATSKLEGGSSGEGERTLKEARSSATERTTTKPNTGEEAIRSGSVACDTANRRFLSVSLLTASGIGVRQFWFADSASRAPWGSKASGISSLPTL